MDEKSLDPINENPVTEPGESPKPAGKKTLYTVLQYLCFGIFVACLTITGVLLWQNHQAKKEKNQEEKPPVVEQGPATGLTREEASLVVATLQKDGAAPEELTNATLSLYYWDTFYEFYETYYNYLAYMNLDPNAMDSTSCTLSPEQTWQEYFVDQALQRYTSQIAVYNLAMAEGYKLSDEAQKQYDDNRKAMAENEKIGELIQETYGEAITLEEYLDYWTVLYYYSFYVAEKMEKTDYTVDELSKFYDEHAKDYEQLNISKTDKNVVTIRHILIEPTDKTVDADWTAAKDKAEQVYNQWLAGDKTEESFAALAKEHSADGNAAQGGIYEDVYPGQMVQTFNDWCFADSRKTGDSGIVETEFGYHIIYFVEAGDYIYWQEVVAADYVAQLTNSWVDEVAATYTLESNKDQILLTLPGQVAAVAD